MEDQDTNNGLNNDLNDDQTHYFIIYAHDKINITTNGGESVHDTEERGKDAGELSIGAKFIEKHSINAIGIIMFHIHLDHNLVIDYLATNQEFRRIGVARYLIYVAQLLSNNVIESKITYLYSHIQNKETYQRMGFKEFPEISDLKYESIRIRFKWDTCNIPKDYIAYRLDEYIETSFHGQDIRSEESNDMELKKYLPKK